MIPRARVAYFAFLSSCVLYLFFLSPMVFYIFMQNDATVALALLPVLISILFFSAVMFLEAIFYLYLSDFIVSRFSINGVLACCLSLIVTGAVFSMIFGLVSAYKFLDFIFLILIIFSEGINYFLSRKDEESKTNT